MNTSIKKFLCTGVIIGLGSHATGGYVEANEDYFACVKIPVEESPSCFPLPREPVEEPHVDRTTSTTTAKGYISGFDEFASAFALQRALPQGEQVEIRPIEELELFVSLRQE